MQYDLKKELMDKGTIDVQWHGEPTKVLVDGESEKREVPTNGVLKVGLLQAKTLLSYSPLWTLKGDKPTEQPYMNRFGKNAPSKKNKKTDKESGEQVNKKVEEFTREEIIEALKKAEATFNDAAETEELRELLVEAQAEQEKKLADEEQKAKEEKKKNQDKKNTK